MDKILQKILKDLKVELTDKFDQNFSQGGFFGKKWQKRKDGSATHLNNTGALRRSIKPHIEGDEIIFTSSTPYASAHNEGVNKNVRVKSKKGKKFTRKMNLPQRQFIGEYTGMEKTIERIAKQAMEEATQDIVQKANH
ncbi:MAG: phage virion morphogenesis protein [Bacteroidetes bacterium]|nr:phage virion morphogenesis protein [Bacteroidota bacterium]MCL2302922.1 phage virion morphogenesis protein [Lentimicrobiaceae bacterium]